jgi:inner membrane protein
MASAFTHAFVAVAAGKVYSSEPKPRWFWTTSIALSILPDLDVIGFAFGIRYEDVFGHRGFSHSILFAAIAGAAVLPMFERRSWKLWLYFTIVTASHGFLDAMTDGGLGIAFFSPIDPTRYFLPWTPVVVSPIGVGSFFSLWGVKVLLSEIVFVWIPVTLGLLAWWRVRSPRPPADPSSTGGPA